jgi:hypothetical protein
MKLMEITRPPDSATLSSLYYDYGLLLGNNFNAGLAKTCKITQNAKKIPAEMNVPE